ncbi:MAG TPA: metal ABC transporter permease [Gammaproteobacteria bacterium]|nr:metal ABC transporter permease [Gammaproteobacteria bacterium]
MNLDALDVTILAPAFAAGLLVLATHVPLGREVLARGIIFIDLAVAQIAALGVIAAHWLGYGEDVFVVHLAAVVAALGGALVLTWTEQRFETIQEALIGVSFVLAATLCILLLANDPHGGEQLRELLVGQILWVTPHALLWVALLYAFVLAVWFGYGARLGRAGFYLLFALSVTASVELVGVYLVFASLIIPALAARRFTGWRALTMGWGVGIVGYAVGLVASALWDLPTGALIVWALAATAVMMAFIGGAGRTSRRATRG